MGLLRALGAFVLELFHDPAEEPVDLTDTYEAVRADMAMAHEEQERAYHERAAILGGGRAASEL